MIHQKLHLNKKKFFCMMKAIISLSHFIQTKQKISNIWLISTSVVGIQETVNSVRAESSLKFNVVNSK